MAIWRSSDRARALRIQVRDKKPIYEYGVMTGETPELVAEFGWYGPEQAVVDDEGNPLVDEDGMARRYAEIRYGVFDSEAQAAQKGWTEEERILVEKKVDWQCQLTPNMVWRVQAAKAAPPWPTYDTTHHNQIGKTAEITGTVHAALAYERENKNRQSVVADLEQVLNAEQAASELTVA